MRVLFPRFNFYLTTCLVLFLLLGSLSAYTSANSSIPKSESVVNGTNFAVLVGVSNYPYLTNKNLIGPRNDALLMRDVLMAKGFNEGNIQLLVDDEVLAKEPTRANIMSALKQVSNKAKKGDYIYLHFAGHGSQAPVLEGGDSEELDGLDEIFLPKDAKGWDYNLGEVVNALKDDEIATAIASMRNNGAFVWAVFDSCHSGTMTRGMVTMRKTSPADLGIPQELMEKAQSNVSLRGDEKPKSPLGSNDGKGGYVAFFAAQTNQTTPEMRLPRGKPNRQNHGLFTYYLAQTLMSAPEGISYRQAAEQILQEYNMYTWRQTTPLFEGDLNASMLGQTAVNDVKQWKVSINDDEIRVEGGDFNQVTRGSILAVVASPTSTDALGYIEVVDTYSLHSEARPYKGDAKNYPPLDSSKLTQTSFARMVQSQFTVSVLYGYETNANISTEHKVKVDAVLNDLKVKKQEGLAIDLVANNETADIRLFAIEKDIYFLADDEDYPCVAEYLKNCSDEAKKRKFIKISLDQPQDQLFNAVHSTLLTIGKANNLRRMGAVLGSSADHLETTFSRKRNGESLILSSTETPALYDKDRLIVSFKNTHTKDIDINMFFIDSTYGVTALFPRNGQANRLHPGESLEKKLKINATTIGRENILVIAVEQNTNSALADFSFLAQPSLSLSRGATRNSGALSEILMKSGFGAGKGKVATRGMALDEDESGVSGAQLFSFDTMPN
jgi:hypothetical protein